ncbi:MAG: hypothetical protein RLZZ188_1036 [Verrucomicrobiota bacterium]|jgi:hypothetical protein
MNNAKLFRDLAAIVAVVVVSGCNEKNERAVGSTSTPPPISGNKWTEAGPPAETVKAATVAYYQEHMLNALADPGFRGIDIRIAAQTVEEVSVTNRYMRKVDGDAIHVHDLEVAVKLGDTKYREALSLALVKLGNEWKWSQVGRAKTRPLNLDENPEVKTRQAESERLQREFESLK